MLYFLRRRSARSFLDIGSIDFLCLFDRTFGWRCMAERYHSCFNASNEIAQSVDANRVVPSQETI